MTESNYTTVMIQSYQEEFEGLIKKYVFNSYGDLEKKEIEDLSNSLIGLFSQAILAYRKDLFKSIDISLKTEGILFGVDVFNVENLFEDFYIELEQLLSSQFQDFTLKENELLDSIYQFIKEYIKLDILLMSRYYEETELYGFPNSFSVYPEKRMDYLNEDEVYSKSRELLEAVDRIENLSYQELNKKLLENKVKVDVVLTDPPYFIAINKNWDNEKDPAARLEYFKDYFRSLVGVVNEDSILMIFNDYSNIEIIEKAIEEVRYEIDFIEAGEELFGIEHYDYLINYYNSRGIDILSIEHSERTKLFNFNTLSYLEWMKSNPASRMGVNKDKKIDNPYKMGYYRDSEYLIIAVNNYDSNHKKELFKNLLWEEHEIFDSINPDSTVREKDVRIHATTKKASVIQDIILKYTNYSDIILDNFSGSGAISISAYENHRRFISSELDEYMYKLSIGRFAMVRNFLGRRPFPTVIQEKDMHTNKLIRNNLYSLFEKQIEEVYSSILKPLNRQQRINYVKESLLEISSKFGLQYLELQRLNIDEIAFILGFVKDYYDTPGFKIKFGVSRNEPHLLFKAFDNTPLILKKLSTMENRDISKIIGKYNEKYKKDNNNTKATDKTNYFEIVEGKIKQYLGKDEINPNYSKKVYGNYPDEAELKEALKTIKKVDKEKRDYSHYQTQLEGNGKFIIDNVLRLYHSSIKSLLYDSGDIAKTFLNSIAYSNYKNKSKSEKQDAEYRYALYLEELATILIENEGNAQKAVANRQSINDSRFYQAREFYKTLAKIYLYLLYLESRDNNYQNTILYEVKSYFINYIYPLEGDGITITPEKKVHEKLEKLLISKADEVYYGLVGAEQSYIEFDNKTIENAIVEGCMEAVGMFKNPHVFEDFDFRILLPRLNKIVTKDNSFKILLQFEKWNAKTPIEKMWKEIDSSINEIISTKFSNEVIKNIFKNGINNDLNTEETNLSKQNSNHKSFNKADRVNKVKDLLDKGKTPKQIAEGLGITIQTVYNYKREIEARNTPKA